MFSDRFGGLTDSEGPLKGQIGEGVMQVWITQRYGSASDTELLEDSLRDVTNNKHDQSPQSRCVENVSLFAYSGLDIGCNPIRC